MSDRFSFAILFETIQTPPLARFCYYLVPTLTILILLALGFLPLGIPLIWEYKWIILPPGNLEIIYHNRFVGNSPDVLFLGIHGILFYFWWQGFRKIV